MLFTGLITVSAFLLVGLGATRKSKGALFMAGGLLLFVVGAVMHFQAFTGFVSLTAAVSAELGIGFLILAGLLSRHKKNARPLFMLGSASLFLAVLVFGTSKLIGDYSNPPVVAGAAHTILVELGEDDVISEITPILEDFGATWEEAFPTVSMSEDADLAQVYIVRVEKRVSKRLMRRLRADTENVDNVEVNFMVELDMPVLNRSTSASAASILENDPLASQQWALDAIHGHEVHKMLSELTPAKKARIAILDTGVDSAHEDVTDSFTNSPATVDIHGHGSHTAGIAGASTNNGLGIASLNWEGRFIEIAGYKALGDQGSGSIEMISQAIIDATKDASDVISMSLGARAAAPKVISDAIAYARRNNVIVIVSAGNANEDAKDHMPSNIEGVIVVSAVDENLAKAKFSNTNMSLSRPITAPGVNILSLKTGGGYVKMSGTSMSTPVVSGLVGIMRSLNPSLSEEDVYSILVSTARTVKDSKRIGKMIDAEAAVKVVLSGL